MLYEYGKYRLCCFFLPSKNKNLQRDFVWTIEQKRELIWSILIDRFIPNCLILNIIDPNDYKKTILQIIDGKQRLSTMLDFYNNKFTIVIDSVEYYYKDLPHDYQLAIKNYNIKYYIIYETFENKISDEDKIKWFKFINFAGTPQDKKHLDEL